ncbi:MAG: hypothetical protein ACRDPV_05170, partial [Gaiellaceae bacterium]
MKLITLIVCLVVALASVGTSAAGSNKPLRACPELRAACKPIGDRPDVQQPRGGTVSPKLRPQLTTDSRGQQVWCAG